jgi:hypothetical protein
LYQRALGILEKALGADHPRVRVVMNELAEVDRSLGRYTEAKRLQRRAGMIQGLLPAR